jgi:hypothetical protein
MSVFCLNGHPQPGAWGSNLDWSFAYDKLFVFFLLQESPYIAMRKMHLNAMRLKYVLNMDEAEVMRHIYRTG